MSFNMVGWLGWILCAILCTVCIWFARRSQKLKRDLEQHWDQEYDHPLRKQMEHELRESEQMYRLIAEASADLIRILEPDMTIRYASPSHEEVLGYHPTELEGTSCARLVAPDERERVARAFQEMIALKKQPYQLNFHAIHKSGTPILFETHGCLVFDELGEPAGVVVVSRDLTKRIQEDEENRRREKLTMAGQLAAGIAHEIRNPLTSIKGFTQLLRVPSEKQSFYAEVVATELARVEEIVNEFLLLAKPEAVEVEVRDAGLLMSDVIMLLSPQAMLQNVQIEWQSCPEETPVLCAASQLKQMFINVIKNAIESMPNGGTVAVSLKRAEDFAIAVIQDEGQGISEQSLQRLGEPFYTTKDKGTGLGLMVSYKIVKDHGGNILVESTPGEGTCMRVTLPVTRDVLSDKIGMQG